MAEDTPVNEAVQQIQTHLRNASQLLRHAKSLDTESQGVLAELMEEMTQALKNEELSEDELSHLVQTTAHLEEALRHHHDAGIVATARAGLERAISNAESEAPITVGLARRLLDALANIGI